MDLAITGMTKTCAPQLAAVLLGLSGCAATITVDWSANNHWRFTVNRLGVLIGSICVVVFAMRMGFGWSVSTCRTNA